MMHIICFLTIPWLLVSLSRKRVVPSKNFSNLLALKFVCREHEYIVNRKV